ncbi:SMP-30/gluconolactonase/LRE family protein [Euzebyella marina]|uniref:SMP-30/gluconolactonase/LRE family protein n=1 Tax=Euzebyella marina TaxID=1761453 RepID=A0A3G2L1D9_9FLAO|nr:SMP-30/gluconolactonase/LRE family protein [Euzebyella marina]AYN66026.1 SMP-30/gluconolactonase/LRE family protein [Euzebyella marina]
MHESTFEAKLLLDTRSVLGEGPVWDWQRQTLYWVDIEGKYLHQLVLETNEHHFWQLPSMTGAAIPEITGNILLALEDGLASFQVANKDFRKHGILKNEDSKMRYNDGKVGPNGDFYIGSMHKEFDPESGNLYKVTSKGQVSVAIPNTTISNGMAWTADKKTFYFSDTENYRIDRYDFDIDSGNLKNRKTAFNIPKELGGADGMCIDSEDMLWIAHWGGACIRQWNPRTGEIIQKIEVAAPHVTSCCFGGKNLDTLYITTARSGLSEEQLEKHPQSGGLFTFKPGVTGTLITYFKEL